MFNEEFGIFIKIIRKTKGCILAGELWCLVGEGSLMKLQPAKVFIEEGEWRVQKEFITFPLFFSHVWTLLTKKKKKES